MQIVTSPQKLRELCSQWHHGHQSIALVPTMGYCHAGHEALMEYGRANADKLVVSVFVNPAQFGPNEDLAQYPRDLDRDAAIAESRGADLVFAPEAQAMYADRHATWVEVPTMAAGLCGTSRPGHFRGVCTIVLKLFNLTRADLAVFGQKDWQQQAILRRMAADLDLPVKVVACPTVREADGLALSSRNVYLSDTERKQAPAIRAALLEARERAQAGETDARRLIDGVLGFWSRHMPDGICDYATVAHPETMEPLERVDGPALLACAVKLGKARLLDNILLRD